MPLQLYNGKFEYNQLRQLRLNFLTTQDIRNYYYMSGRDNNYFLREENFNTAITPANEEMASEFVIKNIETRLSKLKPKEVYQQKIVELEANMNSLD